MPFPPDRDRRIVLLGLVSGLFGLFGIGFPALVGVVSDAFGLTAGLGLYAALPVAILLLLLWGRAPLLPN